MPYHHCTELIETALMLRIQKITNLLTGTVSFHLFELSIVLQSLCLSWNCKEWKTASCTRKEARRERHSTNIPDKKHAMIYLEI